MESDKKIRCGKSGPRKGTAGKRSALDAADTQPQEGPADLGIGQTGLMQDGSQLRGRIGRGHGGLQACPQRAVAHQQPQQPLLPDGGVPPQVRDAEPASGPQYPPDLVKDHPGRLPLVEGAAGHHAVEAAVGEGQGHGAAHHIVGGHAVLRGIFAGDAHHQGAVLAAGEAAGTQLPGQFQPHVAGPGAQLQQRTAAQVGGEHLPHAVPAPVPQLAGQAVVHPGGDRVLDPDFRFTDPWLFDHGASFQPAGGDVSALVCLPVMKNNAVSSAFLPGSGKSSLFRKIVEIKYNYS